jgi:nicotinamidase-related amidase
MLRKSEKHLETKGTQMMTENYSVLEPEVKEISGTVVGEFNTSFFDMLLKYDRIYIWGEASSHCVAETVWSLEKKIRDTNPDLMKKLYILEDCMSPVPKMGDGDLDFPAVAKRAIDGFRVSGMNVVKSTDPI